MAKKSRVRYEPKTDPKSSARSKRQNHDRRCQPNSYEQQARARSGAGGFEPLQVQAPNYEIAYKVQRCKLPLEARTLAQQNYINAIKTHSLTFGIGPAGTGKSYCAAAVAADAPACRYSRAHYSHPPGGGSWRTTWLSARGRGRKICGLY